MSRRSFPPTVNFLRCRGHDMSDTTGKIGSLAGLILALVLVLTGRTVVVAGLDSPAFVSWHAVAILRGAEVVPQPGDPDGIGGSEVYPGASAREVCFGIEVSNLTMPAIAAHIHRGARGTSGPVVVPLVAPDAGGVVSGCTHADADLLSAINAHPGDFYVDIHTSDYPAGAVRGQLALVDAPSGPDIPTIVPDAPPLTPETMPGTGQSGGLPLLAGLALLVLAAGLALRRNTRAI